MLTNSLKVRQISPCFETFVFRLLARIIHTRFGRRPKSGEHDNAGAFFLRRWLPPEGLRGFSPTSKPPKVNFPWKKTRESKIERDPRFSARDFRSVYQPAGNAEQVCPCLPVCFSVWIGTGQLQVDAPATDLHSCGDLEEFESDLSHGGLSRS